MGSVTILAVIVEIARQTPQAEQDVVPIDFIWDQVRALNTVEALTFICFGLVCLLYGWRIFRMLVTIGFALVGLSVGVWTNRLLIRGNEMLLGIICMALFAVFSMPFMRFGVSILGAAAGGILTAAVWYACELPEQYIWAGALIGLVAGFMISFIVFKIAVMLFSSLAGSAIMVAGVLAVLNNYDLTAKQVNDLSHHHNWFLPAALLIPTIAGIILQNKFIKSSRDWSV